MRSIIHAKYLIEGDAPYGYAMSRLGRGTLHSSASKTPSTKRVLQPIYGGNFPLAWESKPACGNDPLRRMVADYQAANGVNGPFPGAFQ
jgi:hypothetical protein